MEMCYNGALVMPSNYAVVNSNEMEYVDGGISLSNAKDIALGILAVVGAVNTVMTLFNNAVKYGAAIKGVSEAAFISGVATKVAATISRIVGWISSHLSLIAGVLGTLIAFAGAYYVGKTVGQKIYSSYKK